MAGGAAARAYDRVDVPCALAAGRCTRAARRRTAPPSRGPLAAVSAPKQTKSTNQRRRNKSNKSNDTARGVGLSGPAIHLKPEAGSPKPEAGSPKPEARRSVASYQVFADAQPLHGVLGGQVVVVPRVLHAFLHRDAQARGLLEDLAKDAVPVPTAAEHTVRSHAHVRVVQGRSGATHCIEM